MITDCRDADRMILSCRLVKKSCARSPSARNDVGEIVYRACQRFSYSQDIINLLVIREVILHAAHSDNHVLHVEIRLTYWNEAHEMQIGMK